MTWITTALRHNFLYVCLLSGYTTYACILNNSERNYFLLVYDLWLYDLKVLVINADENSNIQS
jgi:hypothetical protein